MRVLYVTGACLFNNTSANMSHNAYVQGLIENGAELDIIMASDSWGEKDAKFPRFDGADYHIFHSVSLADRIRLFGRRFLPYHETTPVMTASSPSNTSNTIVEPKKGRQSLRGFIKGLFYIFFKKDPVYPLHKTWINKASKFKSDKKYDLVVSNSSPSAGHRVVANLLDNHRIMAKRWIQIWEDPWYYDLYSNKSQDILSEERSLLNKAQEVLYVSPLTLKYQMEYFPESAGKMGVIPLPAFSFSDKEDSKCEELSFGYFGDYYSNVRNLRPFYDALAASGYKGFIYGDSDRKFQSTDSITVSGRVTLDVLDTVQDKTSVLVHLCNLGGGQIPGKIYHYSVTSKPILFILDGTDEERLALKDYFGRFDRYCFCENNKEDIMEALLSFKGREEMDYSPLMDFSPKSVVKKLFDD